MKNHAPAAGKASHRNPAKEHTWRDLLKEFKAGGQSVREFCAARRLKETAFYFWRREIQRRNGQVSARRQSAAPGISRHVAFAQVLFQPPQPPVTDEGLRLVLGNGRQLLLPVAITVEQVAALVRAIEGAA